MMRVVEFNVKIPWSLLQAKYANNKLYIHCRLRSCVRFYFAIFVSVSISISPNITPPSPSVARNSPLGFISTKKNLFPLLIRLLIAIKSDVGLWNFSSRKRMRYIIRYKERKLKCVELRSICTQSKQLN